MLEAPEGRDLMTWERRALAEATSRGFWCGVDDVWKSFPLISGGFCGPPSASSLVGRRQLHLHGASQLLQLSHQELRRA